MRAFAELHYNILFLLVIPAVVPVFMYFIRHKILWISPFISFLLGLLLTAFTFRNTFTLLITGNDFLGGTWLWIIAPVHLVVSITITSICYGFSYVVKFIKTRKQHDNVVKS